MDITFTDDQVVLVIDRRELMVAKPEIASAVWEQAMADEKVAHSVGNFMTLCIGILIQGVLQFITE